MTITAAWYSRLSCFMRRRICAWMVTSRAVVGSSASSSLGLQRERDGDHHALAHAAGELVRVVLDAAGRLGDADQLQELDGALDGVAVRQIEMDLEALGHEPLDA